MLQPPTPPPMMTTCACFGKSAIVRYLLEPLTPFEIWHVLMDSIKEAIGVVAKVEIDLGNPDLHQPPGGLTQVRQDLHDLQMRHTRGGHLAKITVQQPLILLFRQAVVVGKIRQIEE